MLSGARERKISWGQSNRRQRRRDRDAEGVEGGEVWGGGFPLPIRLGGLGERRELPQRGPGPRRKTNLVHSDALRRPLVAKIHKVL